MENYKNMIAKKYAQKENIKHYIKEVKKGLFKAEQALIEKYFTKKYKVLDLGCGTGREAFPLVRKGFRVTAIDITPRMIEVAKQISKNLKLNVNFRIGDAENLKNFKNDSFGYSLIINQMIEHIPKRVNRIKTLKGVRRILKRNGILILSTHSKYSIPKMRIYWFFADGWKKLLMKIFGKNYKGLELGDRFTTLIGKEKTSGKVFIHIYTPEEVLEDLKRAKFKIIEHKVKEELEKNVTLSEQQRKKSNVVYYVAKK